MGNGERGYGLQLNYQPFLDNKICDKITHNRIMKPNRNGDLPVNHDARLGKRDKECAFIHLLKIPRRQLPMNVHRTSNHTPRQLLINHCCILSHASFHLLPGATSTKAG